MANPRPLPVVARYNGKAFQEFLDDSKTTYESEPLRSPRQWLRSQPVYDRLYAAMQHTRWSARKIKPFVARHRIDMSEFERADYRSFDEFFIRRFRPGARRFPDNAAAMGAFAEARYFGWARVGPEQRFPVKGHSLSAARILGDAARAACFEDGPVLLARLSPVDYHRVHYPDDGITRAQAQIEGRLWTVNQHALQNKDDILFVNERQASVLETENFGRLGFVEIGALTVGRIVQTHPPQTRFARGTEKSYFHYGGSAIVVFGEEGAWVPANDILTHTREGVETYVRLGDVVGRRG